MRRFEYAPNLLLEMAYTRQRAMLLIGGLEMQINLHLLKLVTVPMPDQFRHWRQELKTWLTTIAAIRLKPTTRPGTARFYQQLLFDELFDEPFGDNEQQAMTMRLQLLHEQYGGLIPNLDIDDLVARLRTFHQRFATVCATGLLDSAGINVLLDDFIGHR